MPVYVRGRGKPAKNLLGAATPHASEPPTPSTTAPRGGRSPTGKLGTRGSPSCNRNPQTTLRIAARWPPLPASEASGCALLVTARPGMSKTVSPSRPSDRPMGSGLVGLAVVTSSGWGPIHTRPLDRRARSPASLAPRGRQRGRLVVSAPYGVTGASALSWIACGPLLRRCAACFRAPGTNAGQTDPLSTDGAVVGRATIDPTMRALATTAPDRTAAKGRRG
jgi:hypothetical protein